MRTNLYQWILKHLADIPRLATLGKAVIDAYALGTEATWDALKAFGDAVVPLLVDFPRADGPGILSDVEASSIDAQVCATGLSPERWAELRELFMLLLPLLLKRIGA
jgi:hypothetical protein